MKKRFEPIFISLLIVVCLLLLQLQFIVGSLNTPKESIYLGTVHWPADYFYYLSQMIQGRDNFLFSTMLYTAEKIPLTFIGWQNVLTGRIFLSLGIDIIIVYQLAVLIYLFFFLVVSYFLIREIFPKEKEKRIVAFFFFTTSTAWTLVSFSQKGVQLSYYTYWYNLGNMLSRFGPTPHHLIAYTTGTLGMLLVIAFFKNQKGRLKKGLGLAVVGLILGSINPVHWGLLVGTAGITGICLLIATQTRFVYLAQTWFVQVQTFFLPAIILFLFGLPAALYSRYIFSTSPYNISSIWEATQQLHMNLTALFLGSGLVIPLGFMGLIWYLRRLTVARLLTLVFLLFSSLFYFTSIPYKLHLSNGRFWPSTVYIALAVLSAEAVVNLTRLVKRRLVFIIIMLVYVASIVPTYIQEYRELLTPKYGNAYYYLPKDAYSAFMIAKDTSKKDDLFLIQWPFDETFPALTGRKSVYGFYLFTADYPTKEKEVFNFFDGKVTVEEARAMFKKYDIKYLLGYPWIPNISDYTFLKKIYQNNLLGVWRVEY